MKYKLTIQKKAGLEYTVNNGNLVINGIEILEPIDTSIIEYDIGEGETELGITRCYREDLEVICNLTMFVPDLEPYKNYSFPKSTTSEWDLSKLMTADEVINGNRQTNGGT